MVQEYDNNIEVDISIEDVIEVNISKDDVIEIDISCGDTFYIDYNTQSGFYTLQADTPSSNVANSTPYYFGGNIPIPKNGFIKSVQGVFFCVVGSSETSSLYLVLNDTSEYLISGSIDLSSTKYPLSKLDLDIVVNVGDYIYFKWVTPSWATLPTYVSAQVVVGLEY